jgi:putative Holliday junction resolvase
MPAAAAGRVLAVDWGRKRFGVAISDPARLFAQPLATLVRRPKQRAPVAAVLDLVREHAVAEIVVGLPLTPEGEEGAAAGEARAFGARLAARGGLPVHFLDERMTTAHALKSARRSGVKDAASRGRIDQMAAVGILQAWLDRHQ